MNAAEILKRKVAFEKLILDVSTQFTNLPLDMVDAEINNALQTIGTFINADRSYVFLFSKDDQFITNAYEWCAEGVEPRTDNLKELPAENFTLLVDELKRSENIHIPRVADLPLEATCQKEILQGLGIQSLIVIPMVFNGYMIGLLGFDSVRQEKMWSEEDMALLRLVREIITNALMHKQTEDSLKRAKDKYLDLFENANDMIFTIDPGANFTSINKTASTILGYTKEEMLGKNIRDILTQESFQNAFEALQKAVMLKSDMHEAQPWELEAVTKSGNKIAIEVKARLLWENNRVIGAHGIARDITERKVMEDSLRDSEARFRDLMAYIPGVSIKGYLADGTVVYWNKSSQIVYGYTEDEAVGKNLEDLIIPEELKRVFQDCLKLARDVKVSGEFMSPGEMLLLHKEGYPVPVYSIHTAVCIEKKGPIFFCIDVDLSERKKIEDNLRQSEERYKELANLLPQTVFEIDKSGKFTFMNRAACDAYGYTQNDLDKGAYALDLFIPEDRERVVKNVQKSLSGEDLGGIEYTALRRDGIQVPVIVFASPIVHDNVLSGLRGIVIDITEHKRAENAIRRNLSLLNSIIESTADGILVVDRAGKIVKFNQKFVEMWKIPDSIVQSQNDNEALAFVLDQLEYPEGFLSKVKELYAQPEAVSFDVIEFKDGRSFERYSQPQEIEGEILGRVWSFRDITQRKQDDEERLLNESRILSLIEISRMTDQPDQKLTDFALEKAIALTRSKIGYLAFMNEDETVLTMYSWSKQAMKECRIQAKPLIYPVETTGLWGEAVRQRKPIITNDYEVPNPLKKGYPEGHVPVKRHMNIPLFDGNKIVLVAGVGNKEEPYDQSDVRQLTLLMDGMWKIIKQKQAQESLQQSQEELYQNYSFQALLNIILSESLEDEPLELFLKKALKMIATVPTLPFEWGGSIFLVGDQPDILEMKAQITSDEILCSEHSCSRVSFGRCLCGLAAQTQQIRFSDHNDECHEINFEGMIPHRHYIVPILYVGKTLGVLNLHVKEGQSKDSTVEELLRIIADTLAGIIMRKKADERIEYLAYYDALTELPNRALFLDRVNQGIARAEPTSRIVAVLLMNIDRFKSINDTYGSEVGDGVLKEIARRLSSSVRKGDTIARLANDEFGIALLDVAHPDDIITVLEKIIKDISYPLKVNKDEFALSFSTGIAVYPNNGQNASELLKSAGLALTIAKKQGGKTYQFFTADLNVKASDFMLMEKDLRRAIADEEFILHYQPYWDITTRKIVAMEALIRWQRGDNELVLPGTFIPVLEDTGMIREVGEWVLKEALRQVQQWVTNGYPLVPVSVNMSLVQFRQKDLAETVKRILREFRVSPSLLAIEITESAFMHDIEFTYSVLKALKDTGISISIDDFGKGFSSLSYLKRFPIDILKIDMSFIKDIVSDPDSASIIMAIINMAHALQLKTIAEGIETEEQWKVLRLLRCDMGQGFFFSRPLPAEEVEKLIKQQ
jgi:diguanylate cyclase (GGDEF)-like protein/PAS domain S-box-containing protein